MPLPEIVAEEVVIGPRVEPVADLREAKGEVNREGQHGEWIDEVYKIVDWTSSGMEMGVGPYDYELELSYLESLVVVNRAGGVYENTMLVKYYLEKCKCNEIMNKKDKDEYKLKLISLLEDNYTFDISMLDDLINGIDLLEAEIILNSKKGDHYKALELIYEGFRGRNHISNNQTNTQQKNIATRTNTVNKLSSNSIHVYKSLPKIQSTSLLPADSSPPEATTSSSTKRGASSNYLPVNGNATPGDRGDDEGSENVTSIGEPGSDLRELEGEVNREAVCKTTSGGSGGRVDMCIRLCEAYCLCNGDVYNYNIMENENYGRLFTNREYWLGMVDDVSIFNRNIYRMSMNSNTSIDRLLLDLLKIIILDSNDYHIDDVKYLLCKYIPFFSYNSSLNPFNILQIIPDHWKFSHFTNFFIHLHLKCLHEQRTQSIKKGLIKNLHKEASIKLSKLTSTPPIKIDLNTKCNLCLEPIKIGMAIGISPHNNTILHEHCAKKMQIN